MLTAIILTVRELIFSEEALQRSSRFFFLRGDLLLFIFSIRLKRGNSLRLFVAISDTVKCFDLVEFWVNFFKFLSYALNM